MPLSRMAILPLFVLCSSTCFSAPSTAEVKPGPAPANRGADQESNTMEAKMFPDQVSRVADPESGLEGSLTILRGSDGGAAAVVVELRNPSEEQDVVLKVNTEMSAVVMLTATDQQGTVLSKPAKKFDTSEPQRFVTVRVARASSHRFRVPIAAQLSAGAIPEQGSKGRLVVNVALLFSKVKSDEQPDDAEFKISLLTLHDMDVLFTRAALQEGEKAASAGP